jgi:hypothetical protein
MDSASSVEVASWVSFVSMVPSYRSVPRQRIATNGRCVQQIVSAGLVLGGLAAYNHRFTKEAQTSNNSSQ